VELLLQAIKEKVSHKRFWNDNLILVGDYNLYTGADKDDPTIQIFYDNGFKEVESLKGLDTNASETEAYDRIFLTDNNYFRVGVDSTNKEVAGVFNPFDYVFMDGNEKTYKKFMKKQYGGSKDLDIDSNLTSYYKHPWRKNQLSDHFPIWFELIIDSSDEFLSDKLDEYNSN
jgi:endonuclease/exonuclease/phosphatase family metal-dependent hydrolase